MNNGVYLGNAEIVAHGRMIGRYGGMLTQPMFKGAYIHAVGHGKFFEQSGTRVYTIIVGHGNEGYYIDGSSLIMLWL